ncbi:DnaJ-like protein [Savitreella phatthalungensis]
MAVKVRLYEPGNWLRFVCDGCKRDLECLGGSASSDAVVVCPVCQHSMTLPSAHSKIAGGQDNTYYEILGIARSATAADIKKAYQRRVTKVHPDKTGGSTTAAFLELQEAYSVLSDVAARERYDLHGKSQGKNEADAVDIQARFGALFGGTEQRFDEWVGEIGIIHEMGAAIRKQEDLASRGASQEDQERAAREFESADSLSSNNPSAERKRARRIESLATNLSRKLAQFELQELDSFEEQCKVWMEDLRQESFGAEMLQAIGHVYVLQAASSPHHPAAKGWTGTWIPSLRMKGLYLTSTVSTIRKAYRVKSAFAKLDANSRLEDEKGGARGSSKGGLEEDAAKAAIEAIWEGVRAEIIGVIGEVAQKVLSIETVKHDMQYTAADKTGPMLSTELSADQRIVHELERRAIALERMGKVFERAQRDPGQLDIFEQLAQEPNGNEK